MKPIEYQCDLCDQPMEYSIESGRCRHIHFIDLLRCKKAWDDTGLSNTEYSYHIYAKAIPVFPSQGKRGLVVIRTCH